MEKKVQTASGDPALSRRSAMGGAVGALGLAVVSCVPSTCETATLTAVKKGLLNMNKTVWATAALHEAWVMKFFGSSTDRKNALKDSTFKANVLGGVDLEPAEVNCVDNMFKKVDGATALQVYKELHDELDNLSPPGGHWY